MIHYYVSTIDNHNFRVTSKVLRLGYVKFVVTERGNAVPLSVPIPLPNTNSKTLRAMFKWIDWFENQYFCKHFEEFMPVSDWEYIFFESLNRTILFDLLVASKRLVVPELYSSLLKYIVSKEENGCAVRMYQQEEFTSDDCDDSIEG